MVSELDKEALADGSDRHLFERDGHWFWLDEIGEESAPCATKTEARARLHVYAHYLETEENLLEAEPGAKPVAWRFRTDEGQEPNEWVYSPEEPGPNALGRSWKGWQCEPLFAHPAPSGMGVKIKALEWDEYDRAGDYWVGDTCGQNEKPIMAARGMHILGYFDDAALAKAAAQADYEQRIRQALIPPAGSDAGEEPKQRFEDTFSAETVLLKHFFPDAQSPTVGEITEDMVERAMETILGKKPRAEFDDLAFGEAPIRVSQLRERLTAALSGCRVAEWRPIETAPKTQEILIYLTKGGELGECYWNPAEYDYEESLWWDVARDDECYPRWWMPRAALPASPSPKEEER